ncbi:MAG: NmrA family NAD(P)-binding protein [Myxococcota bacterium]
MTSVPRLLITGAAGKTGAATVHALRGRSDVRVRALVRRDDARAEALRQAGAEVVLGTLDDIRDLRSAMKDVQRAYFLAPFGLNSLDQGLNFAIAASEARLEHITVLGQWLSSASHPAVATRRTWLTDHFMQWIPDVDSTLINVGWFADNTMPLLGIASQLGIFPFALGDGKSAPISNEDIGRVVAGVMTDPAPYAGRTLRPTGPQLIRPTEMADAYGAVLGRRVRYQPISIRMFSKALRGLGLIPPLLQTQLLLYVRDYQEGAFEAGGVTDVVERITGTRAEDFETITRRYVAADPFTKRSLGNTLKALAQMTKIALTPAPSSPRIEDSYGWPRLANPVPSLDDGAWAKTHDVEAAFGLPAPAKAGLG